MEGMTCITCHNPHKGVTATKIYDYNVKCQNCHKVEENVHYSLADENNNCVGCHMQKSGTVDIPHVTVTDHYIRVYAEHEIDKKQTKEQDYVGLVCLTQKKPDAELKAHAYLNFYEKFDRNTVFLDSAMHYLQNLEKKQFAALWIQFYFLKGDISNLKKMKQLSNLALLDAQSLYQLAFAFKTSTFKADKDIATHLLEQAIIQMPFRLDLRNELAIVYLEIQNLKAAKVQIDFVLRETPKNEEALNALGFYYMVSNELALAEACFMKLLKLNPDNENALLNMAKIYLGRNQPESAKIWLQKVLLVHPNHVSAKTILREIEK